MARSLSSAGFLIRSSTVHTTVYPALSYAENLAGPNTVSALSETTIAALDDHRTLARTVDQGLDDAETVLRTLTEVGVDLDEVGPTVEENAVSACSRSQASSEPFGREILASGRLPTHGLNDKRCLAMLEVCPQAN
jgi:hypothetical protein